MHASKETLINTSATSAIVYRSSGCMPYRIDCRIEPIRNAIARPIASPISTSLNPLPRTTRRRLGLEALSAARIPNSYLRCVTEYEIKDA